MEVQDLYVRLFQVSLALFLAGAVLPVLLNSRQKLAGLVGSSCSFIAGSLLTVIAGRILLAGGELKLTAWRIMGDMVLSVRFDALAAFFLLVVGVMTAVCAIYAYGYNQKYYSRESGGYLSGMINLFSLSLVGVVGVDSSVTFMVFWEFMALSSFFLVMFEHEKKKVRAGGYMYLIMTHVCGVFLSFAFLLLYMYTGSLEFSAYYNVGAKLPDAVKTIVFFCFFVGFGAKMGLFPINVWLPRAYPVAPSSATALMSSAMIKTAVYAFLRVCLDFMGDGPAWWGLAVMAVGTLSAVVGIMLGVIQNDTKRFLAYSSVENMGIICTGIGAAYYFQAAALPTAGALAMLAVLYHVLNHSVFKSLLFMGAGALLRATGTCNVSSLGGLIHKMPWTAGAFLLGGMSLASLPPLGGFMSEWALLQSVIHMVFDCQGGLVKLLATIVVALLGFSGAIAAVAVVKHFGTAFLAKPRSEAAANAVEVCWSMRLGMLLLTVFAVVLGVFPGGVTALTGQIISRHFGVELTGSMLLYVPFNPQSPQVMSPAIAIGVTMAIIALVYVIIRLLCGKSSYTLEDVWTCGSIHTTAMEYTASSYSHPVLRVFQNVFGLRRRVTVDQEYEYYPKRIHHELDIAARVGDNVYKPTIDIMVEVFKRIKQIQNGNLHLYLSYLVAALVITLLCSNK